MPANRTLTEGAIKRCNSGAELAQQFVHCLLEEQQWWRILHNTHVGPWVRSLATERITLTIHPTHFTWLGQKIPFEWLHRRGLLCIRRLIALQSQRGTFFKARVSHTYTVHYERCTLNGLLESAFDRRACWAHTVRFAPREAQFIASTLSEEARARILKGPSESTPPPAKRRRC